MQQIYKKDMGCYATDLWVVVNTCRVPSIDCDNRIT
jgi:hypothetical protein